jgi:hypothetical protein
MEVNGRIGWAAWKVLSLLSVNGPLSLAQLKRKVRGDEDHLHFAIRWLAREDNVIVTQERRTVWVQLRS